GRQGGGGTGAGAPDHAAAGDVAAQRGPVVRGHRGAGRDAGPGHRSPAVVRRGGAGRAGHTGGRRQPPAAVSMPTWQASRALRRAVLLTGLLTIAAVVLGRVDLVVFAAPFAVGAAWGLRHRRGAVPAVEVAAGTPGAAPEGTATVEGGPAAGLVSVTNTDQAGLDVVVVRTVVSPWLDLPGADRPHALLVPPG